jgi:hypothetical protein
VLLSLLGVDRDQLPNPCLADAPNVFNLSTSRERSILNDAPVAALHHNRNTASQGRVFTMNLFRLLGELELTLSSLRMLTRVV